MAAASASCLHVSWGMNHGPHRVTDPRGQDDYQPWMIDIERELYGQTGPPAHVHHSVSIPQAVAEVLAGAAAGAAVGAIAGPPGMVVGAVIGSLAGAAAELVLEREAAQHAQHDAELDAQIGVVGGYIGEANRRQRGT